MLQCLGGSDGVGREALDEARHMTEHVLQAIANFAATADIFVQTFALDGGMGRCISPLLSLGDDVQGMIDNNEEAVQADDIASGQNSSVIDDDWERDSSIAMDDAAIAMALAEEAEIANYKFVD